MSNTLNLPQAGSILTTGRRRVYCACAMGPCCQLFCSLSYGFWSRSLKTRTEHYKVSLEVKSNAPLKCWYISFHSLKGNVGLHQRKTLYLKNTYLFPRYRLDNRRIVSNFRQGQEIFIFSRSSRQALEHTPAAVK